jgi:isopentenyl phosphate kinase
LHKAGVPALAFPASSSAVVADGKVLRWELAPLQDSLRRDLVPVVFGDVAFDQVRGGTILSTEDIFAHLALQLKPTRILLAGVEEGVWSDYPANTDLMPVITPETWRQKMSAVQGSAATDVTGGMSGKVGEMIPLVEAIPGLEVLIFSAEQPEKLRRVMVGENLGTVLKSGNTDRDHPAK